MSNKSEAQEFFNRLTGKTSKRINIRDLSSAQRARFVSWCTEKGFKIESLEYQTDASSPQSLTEIPTDTDRIKKSAINFGNGNGIGIGIDIQNISELFPESLGDYKSNDRLLNIFTTKEIAFAEMKKAPEDTLAGIFCAKEAIYKAAKLNNFKSWADIEISHSEDGIPYYKDYRISISHNSGYVVAVALTPQNNNAFSLDIIEPLKNRIDILEKKINKLNISEENKLVSKKNKILNLVALFISAGLICTTIFNYDIFMSLIP